MVTNGLKSSIDTTHVEDTLRTSAIMITLKLVRSGTVIFTEVGYKLNQRRTDRGSTGNVAALRTCFMAVKVRSRNASSAIDSDSMDGAVHRRSEKNMAGY